jgi:hypothetical protein
VQTVDEAVPDSRGHSPSKQVLGYKSSSQIFDGDGIALALPELWLGFSWGEPFTVEEASNSESVRMAIVEEIQRRGDALARNLAAISYGLLLRYKVNALEPPRAQSAECFR